MKRYKKVTAQSRLERESLSKLQLFLLPWVLTEFDQRDDYGRDGIAQLTETTEEDEVAISHLVIAVQVKAHGAAFAESHSERLETVHIDLWTRDGAPPTLLAIWSKADDEFRFRTAREILSELESSKPEWREQKTVSVRFSQKHAFATNSEALSSIERRVRDEVDSVGGVSRYHSSVRRVVLSHMFAGRMKTANSFSWTLSDGRKYNFITGPGWDRNDLDTREVHGKRVLTSAIFLFEKVYYPFHLTTVAIRALGSALFFDLLERGLLIPFRTYDYIEFSYEDGRNEGDLILFNTPDFDDVTRRAAASYLEEVSGVDRPIDRLLNRLEVVRDVTGQAVINETKRDLQNERLRNWLGLRPTIRDKEPIWDAVLVNRLVNMNTCRAIAENIKADVIYYEGGVSRIASEKDFSYLKFHRVFPSSEAFDKVLRRFGTPDVGLLASTVGVERCMEIATSTAGQDFRDWFWEVAASSIGAGADISTAFENRVGNDLLRDNRSVRLPAELKLGFVKRTGSDYLLGSPFERTGAGFGARSDDGRSQLRTQAQNHSKRRIRLIADSPDKPDSIYNLCPCGSGEKYKFCCGRNV